MEKDIFNIDKNKLSYGRGYVYSLQYHLVWCTKYRKKGFKKTESIQNAKKCYRILQKNINFRFWQWR